MAREKGGIDSERIKNDPAFQRTCENGSEFGTAGKGGKLIRNAIRILLQNAKDSRVTSRLTTQVLKIVTGVAELDFVNETFVFDDDQTAILPYDGNDTAVIDLSATITANSTLPVVQVLGIEFYQEVNGEMYPLKNGSYNALAVKLANKV